MNRIKVVNEVADLVQLLRSVSTKVRVDVLKEVSEGWKTAKEIEKKYGKAGKDALKFFEKMRLVEIRWQSESSTPEKAYHTCYSSVTINASCPINEISDVLGVAIMSETEFTKHENKIKRAAGDKGKFVGDIAEELKLSPTMLKSLVKRSTKLEYRGHRVEKIKDD
jgi:predicted DNA-binding ArsR family transcriptional regulator